MNKVLGHNVSPDSGLTFIDATARATSKSRTTVSLDAERVAIGKRQVPGGKGA